jgi:hypothetical protein
LSYTYQSCQATRCTELFQRRASTWADCPNHFYWPAMDRPRSRHLSVSIVSGTLLLSFLLCGCGGQKRGSGTSGPPLVKHGLVQGGAQPRSNSTIQLYAAGTTGDGSAATVRLTQPVSTDASGEFDFRGSYSCPSASSLVYVCGDRGQPRVDCGTDNTALTLMAALGACRQPNGFDAHLCE